MAASNFAPALALVLAFEGGFVNDPADPGGATCYGITLATLSAWRSRTCSVSEVRELRPADVQPIYKARYWDIVQADRLAAGADLLCFDGAVNQGPGAAARILQRAVGAAVDGQVGPGTLAAAARVSALELVDCLANARLAAYHEAAGFDRYGAGWVRRLQQMHATARTWAARATAAPPAAAPQAASATSDTVEVDV